MRYINKIINIALIFMLIGVILGQDTAYALRPSLQFNKKAGLYKNYVQEKYEQLYRGKGIKTIIQELDKIDTLIRFNEDTAIQFIRSFNKSDLLMLLNSVLYKTRKKDPEKKIVVRVRNILTAIFDNKNISSELIRQMDFFNATENQTVSIEFLDGADGKSAKFIKETFPEILTILRDPRKIKDLFLLLSLYRFSHYIGTPDYINNDEALTPLEYSIKHGFYIALGKNLYVTALSESFRRHIIFKIDENGEFSKAVEILIPGDNKKERMFLGRSRLDVCRDIYETEGENCDIVKTHLMAEYPRNILPYIYGYGDIFKYKRKDPLRIFIHDYSGVNQGRRFCEINGAYFKRVKCAEPIQQILILINRFVKNGYYFNRGYGSDLTFHNFRLCVDGAVRFSGDLDSFYKKKKDNSPDRDINDIFIHFKDNSIMNFSTLKLQVYFIMQKIGAEDKYPNLYEAIRKASLMYSL
jgi:hypothetical protein